jgi:hypothetical protein
MVFRHFRKLLMALFQNFPWKCSFGGLPVLFPERVSLSKTKVLDRSLSFGYPPSGANMQMESFRGRARSPIKNVGRLVEIVHSFSMSRLLIGKIFKSFQGRYHNEY